jgi:hypothetical protein
LACETICAHSLVEYGFGAVAARTCCCAAAVLPKTAKTASATSSSNPSP